MQRETQLWQVALAVSALWMLACSALVYGQAAGSGSSSVERDASSSRSALGRSELDELNQQVIKEFWENQGKMGGRYAQVPLLLLTTTGAKSGRALIRLVAYT